MGDIWPYGPPEYTTWQAAYDAMRALGMSAGNADIMAALGGSEAAYDLKVVNDTPATGDYSVGVWQINYYGSLRTERTRLFGRPGHVARSGVTGQARVAYSIWTGQGFGAWGSYTNGGYKQFLHGSGGGGGSGAEPTVREGSTGHAVRTLQTDLNLLGHHLTVDGVFGPATRAAVIIFQRNHGLAQDGVVGPQTWAALSRAVVPSGTPSGTPTGGAGPVAPNEPAVHVDGRVHDAWSLLGHRSGPLAVGQLNRMSAVQNEMRNRRR